MKPCPFCGSKNVEIFQEYCGDYTPESWIYVRCNECRSSGTPFKFDSLSLERLAATKHEAVLAWDTRTVENN